MIDPIWFSPLNVMHHGKLLRKQLTPEQKKAKQFRKVIEAYAVAQMLTAMMDIENREYWMQLVGDDEGSPDIKTIRYSDSRDGKFDFLEQVDVEVVEYEGHSNTTIPQFVIDKKLSKRKGYDENTIILCHIGSGINSFLPDGESIKKIMGTVDSKCHVLLLTGTNPEATELDLISLKPNVGLIKRFVPELILTKRKPMSGVVNFKLGVRQAPTKHPENKHYPFEKIGFIPDETGSYAKV